MPAREIIEAVTRRLYHATAKDFDRFEIGHEGKNSWLFGAWPVNRAALFFTANHDFAGEFIADPEKTQGYKSGARMHPVRLSLRRPVRLDKIDAYDLAEEIRFNPNWISRHQSWELFDGEEGKDFVAALKRAGYDGAIFKEDDGEGIAQQTYAVFDPSQIHSAIGYRTGVSD